MFLYIFLFFAVGCSESLGVENRNKITDGQMTASSTKSYPHSAFFGRLNNQGKKG